MLENQKETSASQRVWRTAEAGLADSPSAKRVRSGQGSRIGAEGTPRGAVNPGPSRNPRHGGEVSPVTAVQNAA
jgi:hypothetical protein